MQFKVGKKNKNVLQSQSIVHSYIVALINIINVRKFDELMEQI